MRLKWRWSTFSSILHPSKHSLCDFPDRYPVPWRILWILVFPIPSPTFFSIDPVAFCLRCITKNASSLSTICWSLGVVLYIKLYYKAFDKRVTWKYIDLFQKVSWLNAAKFKNHRRYIVDVLERMAQGCKKYRHHSWRVPYNYTGRKLLTNLLIFSMQNSKTSTLYWRTVQFYI